MSTLSRLLHLGSPGVPSATEAPALSRLPTSPSRPYVLVIEDHPEAAECMRCALEQLRVYSMISHDGETGLKMAGVMHFNLIILDVLMPGMNGFEVCRAIRKAPALRDVPVMFVTCVTSPEAQEQAAGLGAAHYLCKPFDLVDFQTQVQRILTDEGKRRG